MPLRIVFFNRSFYPDITATAQLLTELCEDLTRDYDCRVTVISGSPLIKDTSIKYSAKMLIAKERFKEIEILRVKSTVFSHKVFWGRIANYLSYFVLSFIASFKLKKPDLVVSLTDPPIIGLVAFGVSRRFNIPFVISVRDVFPEVAGVLDGTQNKFIIFLLDYINRFCLKRAKRIIVLGQTMARRIEDKGMQQNKISVIPDWADCLKMIPLPKENPFSIEHNLTNFFVVMYSGNLGASSGMETMLESAYLLKDYKDICFVFIGEGIIKDRLLRFAGIKRLENTKFFPYQPQEIMPYSFASADVFVISLKRGLAGYSLPSKLYPILASGRPYIAAMDEKAEAAQLAKEFNCGILANPQDPLDLAEKIVFLYKNKELRIKMQDNSRRIAISFARPKGARSYYELFKKLLSDEKTF